MYGSKRKRVAVGLGCGNAWLFFTTNRQIHASLLGLNRLLDQFQVPFFGSDSRCRHQLSAEFEKALIIRHDHTALHLFWKVGRYGPRMHRPDRTKFSYPHMPNEHLDVNKMR